MSTDDPALPRHRTREALRRPPRSPQWATHSVVEDGGLTHERVSLLHPMVGDHQRVVGAAFAAPGDVSLSVFDRPSGRRWVRTPPTIQVEGGSYTLAEARRLVLAIEELLALVS